MILEIKIAYELETGKIAVFAPMNQKDVCYAILKKARKTIRDHKKVKPNPILGADSRPLPIHVGALV